MATPAESTLRVSQRPKAVTRSKFWTDAVTIFEIRFLMFLRGWYWYLIMALVFPVGMFYFARALAPDSPESIRRAMVGTIVFGATMMTANMLAQNLIQDRFRGRLKLIITMPVSKAARFRRRTVEGHQCIERQR